MRSLIAIALTLALVLPATAAAKELTSIDVCGTNGCKRISDHATLRAFEEGSATQAGAPSGPQPSYLLHVHMRDGEEGSVHSWTSRWLPSAGLIVNEDGPGNFVFTTVAPKLERALRHAAQGRTARAARSYAAEGQPAARVVEVVNPPRAAADDEGAGGFPTLAWIGIAAGLIAVGGAIRLRLRAPRRIRPADGDPDVARR